MAQLTSLDAAPDRAIDTSEAPEIPDWGGARRGLFYRPVEQQPKQASKRRPRDARA